MRKIDLTGQIYGDWLVLKESDVRKSKKVYWECKCLVCGKLNLCSGNNLRTGKTKHCGCQLSKIRSDAKLHDLTGRTFGLLTVLGRAKENESYGRSMWRCRCECGTITVVSGCHLESGATSSCGCCKYSKGEQKIANILNSAGIQFDPHHYINIDGNRYYFDFYVNDSYYIEYDGVQHFVGWGRDKENLKWQQDQDRVKTKYCIDNNIPLIRIPYTSLDALSIDDLIINHKEKPNEV